MSGITLSVRRRGYFLNPWFTRYKLNRPISFFITNTTKAVLVQWNKSNSFTIVGILKISTPKVSSNNNYL